LSDAEAITVVEFHDLDSKTNAKIVCDESRFWQDLLEIMRIIRLERIRDGAFDGAALVSIMLPPNIVKIGAYAFPEQYQIGLHDVAVADGLRDWVRAVENDKSIGFGP
jgi:hypothetical protein